MNHSRSHCMVMPSTSSFVGYTDFTTTSAGNYSNILRIITKLPGLYNQPNDDTIHAIAEARDHENLKTYNNVDDFFSDLEK